MWVRNVLRSDRLTLRELSSQEALALAERRDLPGQDWAAGYPTEGTSVAATMCVRATHDGLLRPGFGMYQIIDDHKLSVGDIGFHPPTAGPGTYEIGYGIAESHRGRGLVSHSVRLLSRWAFAQRGVEALLARTNESHWPSRRVLEAAGFALVTTNDGTCWYRCTTPPATL